VVPGGPEVCPQCKGKRFLVYDVWPGHPLFGELVRCTRCTEGCEDDPLRKICGLTREMQGWTFANTVRYEGIAEAYDVAQELATHPRRFLTLLGDYGIGKTRLLACIVNAARSAGLPAVYTTTASLLDHLRAAYAPNAEVRYDERLELVTSARVLCLDEFDRFNSTDWAQEKFFQLVDVQRRLELPADDN
jgi:DNA replication protein DnaC